MMRRALTFYVFLFKAMLLFCESPLEPQLSPSIDLEDRIQEFVLETKRIEIPGYPNAFNPSIIRWNGKLLMSFRIIPDINQKYNSEIGVVWLNENFLPVTTPQILNLCPSYVSPNSPSRAEDGHLLNVNGTLYLTYDDNRDEKLSKGGFRVYIAELEVVDETIIPKNIEAIFYFEGESRNIREKGWVPFAYKDHLLLAYSISPHRIFRYLPGTKGCETIAETNPNIHWDWGILRGSTPGVNINGQFNLAFFHSSIKMRSIHSNEQESLHYFIGAYTFSLEPPFKILTISPEPIVGKNFYHGASYKPYWHAICAVFPAGYICKGDILYLFYGRQDHEIWVAAIDKQGLLNSLIPVSTF